MIHLLVDEAYAFDYLSILKVKSDKINNDVHYKQICLDLEVQLTTKNYETNLFEVLNSEQYKQLIECNRKIFDKIDLLRSGDLSITAKEIDDLNMKRFFAKNSLQKMFFKSLVRVEEKL